MTSLRRTIAIGIVGLAVASGAYLGLQVFNPAPPSKPAMSMNPADYPDELEWVLGDNSEPRQIVKCKPPEIISVFQQKMHQDAPIVVKATVIGIANNNGTNTPIDPKLSSGRYAYAHIDGVIKGSMDGKTTLFVVLPLALDNRVCVPIAHVGDTGILYGTIANPGQLSDEIRHIIQNPEVVRFMPLLEAR